MEYDKLKLQQKYLIDFKKQLENQNFTEFDKDELKRRIKFYETRINEITQILKVFEDQRNKKTNLLEFRGKLAICNKCEYRNNFSAYRKCIKSQFDSSECFPESKDYCSYKETKRSDDNQVMCPFCNHLEFIEELYDYENDSKEIIQCGSCEKMYEITFEKTIEYNLIGSMVPINEVNEKIGDLPGEKENEE